MMRKTLRTTLLLMLGTLVTTVGPAAAQHMDHNPGAKDDDEAASGHSHMMCELHGGEAVMTADHHFEVLFTAGEVRLYGYDGKQTPLANPKGFAGTVLLQPRNGSPVSLDLIYTGPDPAAGRTQGYLAAPYDFTKVEEGSMKALVTVTGLGKKPLEFMSTVKVSELAMYACPMNDSKPAADPMSCPKCGMDMTKTGGGHMNHGEHGGH